jgi:predicted transcriptional regulator
MLAVEQGDIVEENFVEVAQMIGCSYRQLQRVIKHFISLGYIEKVKRSVYHILDRSALEELGEDLYFT